MARPEHHGGRRQAIARLVLEQVVVRVERNSEHVGLECHWPGGKRTRHEVIRTVQCFEQLRRFDRLLARIRGLREEGGTVSGADSWARMAAQAGAAAFRTRSGSGGMGAAPGTRNRSPR